MVDVVTKGKRGRPPMSAEEKARVAALTPEQKAAEKQARKEAREAKVKATTAGKQPSARKPRGGNAGKSGNGASAPKRQTVKENDPKTRFEDLTDEQQFKLVMDHTRKISAVEAKLELAKTDVKNARSLARAEIGTDALHRIKLYSDLQTEEGQDRLRRQMDMTMQVATWAGMPTKQGDLFEDVDRTPNDERHYKDGKRAGIEGKDPKPPSGLTGASQQAFMRGWHDGQAVNINKVGTGKPFGAPPAAQGKTKDDPSGALGETAQGGPLAAQVDWEREGVKAFEAGSSDTPGGDVPPDHYDEWRAGYGWARDRKAQKDAEPKGADYWREQGAAARRNNEGGTVPDAVPEEFREVWLNSWGETADEYDEQFWKRKGGDAWSQGANGEPSEDVPTKHHDHWKSGWHERKAAHEQREAAE